MVGFLTVASLLLAPLAVQAEAAGEADKAARKACLVGDVAKGVDILADLYIETKNPTYIFNQGRCFEQNRRYEDAIARFREYLSTAPSLSAGVRAEVEKRIATCQSYATVAQEPKHQRVTTEQVLPAPRPPVMAPVALGRQSEKPAEVASAGSALRTAGVVTAALGTAALITGLVLNWKVDSMANDLEHTWNPDTDATRKTYRSLSWIGYGTGAACVVGGAALYYLGAHARTGATSNLALAPALTPDLAGLTISGAF